MTPEMLVKARASAQEAGLTNVEFREGLLEALPIATGWADVVISNGVLNLVPDKAAALAEMHRVLRPGGRLQAADIVLERPVSPSSKEDVDLWTGCIAGGLLEEELRELIAGAGFVEVDIVPGTDVFAGAPSLNAAAFGTRAWASGAPMTSLCVPRRVMLDGRWPSSAWPPSIGARRSPVTASRTRDRIRPRARP
jgi:SAM-dependent methyltransferase